MRSDIPIGINIHQAAEHLFRHEAGKLVAVLTRVFGPHNLHLAEDVVQDTLLKALESWKLQGLPANPTGWLFTVARNKALDVLRREKTAAAHVATLAPMWQPEAPDINELMQENQIPDAQLRMMFVCCHPKLQPEAQVALILKTLCGFSVAEIAKAFITGTDAIEKRLYRARQQFDDKSVVFDLPLPQELDERLDIVLAAIYFIFNEGNNAARSDTIVRMDLLEEAMRLAQLLGNHPFTRRPKIYALLALFCFNSARADTRQDDAGNILLLQHQNRSQWSQPLIAQGTRFLEQSVGGDASRYHLEAMIAYEHAVAPAFEYTNWSNIIAYYNLLFKLHPSPVVALNRAIAIGEKDGPGAGIEAIENIAGSEKLIKYYLLPATLGEMYARLQQRNKAAAFFTRAIALTTSAAEKKLLQAKLTALG
jgi:RNA polymerase sigma factor (sigma-70 family)